jgi:hypothetical protein
MSSVSPIPTATGDLPLGRFVLRLLWVAVRLVACAYLGHSGAEFFYQGF